MVIASMTVGCHELRDPRHAEESYGRLGPYAGRNVDVGWGVACFGPVDHYRGLAADLLGRYEAALRHFEAVSEMNHRMGFRPWDVHHSLALARLLVSTPRRSRVRARQVAREARREAERLGFHREAAALSAIADVVVGRG